MKYFDVVDLIVCDMNMSGWGYSTLKRGVRDFSSTKYADETCGKEPSYTSKLSAETAVVTFLQHVSCCMMLE